MYLSPSRPIGWPIPRNFALRCSEFKNSNNCDFRFGVFGISDFLNKEDWETKKNWEDKILGEFNKLYLSPFGKTNLVLGRGSKGFFFLMIAAKA